MDWVESSFVSYVNCDAVLIIVIQRLSSLQSTGTRMSGTSQPGQLRVIWNLWETSCGFWLLCVATWAASQRGVWILRQSIPRGKKLPGQLKAGLRMYRITSIIFYFPNRWGPAQCREEIPVHARAIFGNSTTVLLPVVVLLLQSPAGTTGTCHPT